MGLCWVLAHVWPVWTQHFPQLKHVLKHSDCQVLRYPTTWGILLLLPVYVFRRPGPQCSFCSCQLVSLQAGCEDGCFTVHKGEHLCSCQQVSR